MCSRAEEPFFGRAGSAVHDGTSPLKTHVDLLPPCLTVKRIMPFLAPRKPAGVGQRTRIQQVLDAVQAASCGAEQSSAVSNIEKTQRMRVVILALSCEL